MQYQVSASGLLILKVTGTCACSFDHLVLQNGGTLLHPEVENRKMNMDFADLELEYNKNVENGEQTLPYGVVPLAEHLAYCLMLYS
ncbi:hypothetical protein T11_7813 [Trichinella zimbabwensis]|uniref:Uncharacterized protein n=1 Tax=Trichinella zimbabwensis TaxID=268475 RepID=A0A0V1HL70_9BILA|nr:hypothetical protein T11_7813 [Trichinella zimbabwensis]